MALITFDLDGTLQQNPFRTGVWPSIGAALAPACLRHFPDTPLEEAPRRVIALVRAEFRRRQEAQQWEAAYDWDDIVASVAAALGHRDERPDVVALVRRHCTPEHIAALPGARACLAELRAAGHTLKVATNGFAAYQEPVLEALDLLEFFSDVLTPDRCHTAKPIPEFLLAAGAPPALHVGDSLVHDTYGARQAGFASIWYWPRLTSVTDAAVVEAGLAARFAEEAAWVPTGGLTLEQCRPDFVARDLAAVPGIVAAWAG